MKLVTIYVDEDEWEDMKKYVLKLSAERGDRVSIGSYLMELHKTASANTLWSGRGIAK